MQKRLHRGRLGDESVPVTEVSSARRRLLVLDLRGRQVVHLGD